MSLSSLKLDNQSVMAALVVMGWTKVAPNLLLRPINFRGDVDLGISEDGRFVFVSDNTALPLDDGDKITYTFDEGTLYFTASTIMAMVLENTANG